LQQLHFIIDWEVTWQGCWVGHTTLARKAGLSVSHLSDALSDLRGFGYISSYWHPFKKRERIKN